MDNLAIKTSLRSCHYDWVLGEGTLPIPFPSDLENLWGRLAGSRINGSQHVLTSPQQAKMHEVPPRAK